jgi:hypothetical protein
MSDFPTLKEQAVNLISDVIPVIFIKIIDVWRADVLLKQKLGLQP